MKELLFHLCSKSGCAGPPVLHCSGRNDGCFPAEFQWTGMPLSLLHFLAQTAAPTPTGIIHNTTSYTVPLAQIPPVHRIVPPTQPHNDQQHPFHVSQLHPLSSTTLILINLSWTLTVLPGSHKLSHTPLNLETFYYCYPNIYTACYSTRCAISHLLNYCLLDNQNFGVARVILK